MYLCWLELECPVVELDRGDRAGNEPAPSDIVNSGTSVNFIYHCLYESDRDAHRQIIITVHSYVSRAPLSSEHSQVRDEIRLTTFRAIS